MLGWILGFSILGSLGVIVGTASFLLIPASFRITLVPSLVSYATGTLLAAPVMAAVLAGMILFFVLEKLVLWRHCHDGSCPAHGRAAPLILVGDAFHNFVDGIVIAAAFVTSVPLGIATSLAVIAHEVPQEIGDFAILLDSGYGRGKALLLNSLSAAATLPGAVAAYFWLQQMDRAVPYILAISAASFIYIATADLIPGLHRQTRPGQSARQLLLLFAGIATIVLIRHGH